MTSSCEACGWMAAVASALAFGSFGVPIKSRAAVSVNVDPLVFQSYKTLLCFLTAWLILFHEPFTFTPWGIVSGLFWIPGGVATVYAIQSVGLAMAIGIGSSLIVLVSFVWGIFVFQEPVRSKWGACAAIACMMTGLMGMSYYSSTSGSSSINNSSSASTPATSELANSSTFSDRNHAGDGLSVTRDHEDNINVINLDTYCTPRGDTHYQDVPQHAADCEDRFAGGAGTGAGLIALVRGLDHTLKQTTRTEVTTSCAESMTDDDDDNDDEVLCSEYGEDGDTPPIDDDSDEDDGGFLNIGPHLPTSPDRTICRRIALSKRHRGMLAAAFCGIWGGSVMAPMKFCSADTQGTSYLLSFAIGASIVNLTLWILRFLFSAIYYQSFTRAYYHLPSFHIRVLWWPGGLSGILWSIGNFFSLISVLNLGEGVGYPLSQTSILVSGLWGIFYFREITGFGRVSKWILSSLLTIFGILLLSYEHHSSGDKDR